MLGLNGKSTEIEIKESPAELLHGLVEPLSGDKFFVTALQVNTPFFEFLLQEFSRQEPQVYKIIFLDKAGYYRAKHLQVPDNIRGSVPAFFQPGA